MAKHRRLSVEFPFGGLDRSGPYRQQKPYTSTDMLNVRSYGTTEGRRRGGSRPGLVESCRTDIGSSPRMLHNMQLTVSDGFTAWSDNFDGSSMGDAWSQASWSSNQPSILPQALASIDNSVDDAASVRDSVPDLDTSNSYAVEAFLVPWDGAWHGSYSLYMRMDDSSPDYATEGVEVKLTMTGSSGNITAELNSYLASTKTVVDSDTIAFTEASPGWLTVVVASDAVTVYWNGSSVLTGTADTHTGTRVGLGLECTVDGGLCLMNTFRVQYYSTSTLPSNRTLLVASAEGNLWYEEFYGVMSQLSTNLSLRDDVRLASAQGGQLLYICDYGLAKSGTDGTVSGTTFDDAAVVDWSAIGANIYDYVVVLDNVSGDTEAGVYAISSISATFITLSSAPGDGTCSYRIERQIKVYDHVSGTLSLLTSTAGQIPTGNHLMVRYLDRLFIGGGDLAPNAWFASRQGDYTDWDYTQEDSQRAIYGPSSEQGVPGPPLTALSATSDDYLILFCETQAFRMRGDPAYGGSMDTLSEVVGSVDSHSLCHGPSGEIIFLSREGMYAIGAGGNTFPISLSREVLPRELRNIDVKMVEASMEFDFAADGIQLFLSPDDPNDRIHWWFDWETKTFWPMSLQGDHEPTAICSVQSTSVESSGVVLGSRDGKLRMFNALANNDCGESFSAYVVMGPVALNSNGTTGQVISIDAVLGADSGDVTWGLLIADTFEGVASATASPTGIWSSGLNATERPMRRGQAFSVKLTSTENVGFVLEDVVVVTKYAGRRRIS